MVRLAFTDPILFQYYDYAHIIKPITNINKSKQFVLWYFSNSVSRYICIFTVLETMENTKKSRKNGFEYGSVYRIRSHRQMTFDRSNNNFSDPFIALDFLLSLRRVIQYINIVLSCFNLIFYLLPIKIEFCESGAKRDRYFVLW